MRAQERTRVQKRVERERWEIVARLENWLERPMIALAFVWLALLILEFVAGEKRWLLTIGTAIWVLFCIDFLLKLVFAPSKLTYVRRNWLTALSLAVPALRVFRVFAVIRMVRVARVARSLRLLRVVSSINRSMRALGVTMRQRGFGYVVVLTLLVTLAGAAGMLAFEKRAGSASGLNSYSEALWWTAMIITTMGTDYWPESGEGRLLCFLLALYAFAVFGYVTATLATFFIGRDAMRDKSRSTSDRSLDAMRAEIQALREQMQANSFGRPAAHDGARALDR